MSVDDLTARIEALRIDGRRMNAGNFSDEAWKRWEERMVALVAETRSLPLTTEYVHVRALMAQVATGDDPSCWEDMCSSPEGELAMEIIQTIAGKAVL